MKEEGKPKERGGEKKKIALSCFSLCLLARIGRDLKVPTIGRHGKDGHVGPWDDRPAAICGELGTRWRSGYWDRGYPRHSESVSVMPYSPDRQEPVR